MLGLYYIVGFAVVTSVVWGVWAGRYFFAAYNISGVGQILPTDMSYMIFATVLPIILLLMVVAIVFFAIAHRTNRAAIALQMVQNRVEIESLVGISNSLISLKKLGFSSQFFATLPILLDDIGLVIADIIAKTGMASEVVLFDAISKPRDGKLYAICKIMLDIRDSTPHFEENLRRRIKRDEVVLRTIEAFLAKYKRLMRAVEDYDTDGLVKESLENGALGRVHGVIWASANEASA